MALLPAPIGEPQVLLGQVLEAEGRDDEAREAFKAALDIDPDHFPARLQLAEQFSGLAAEMEYLAAIERHPGEPAVHQAYGYFLWQAQEGREDEALERFLHSILLAVDRKEEPDGRLLGDTEALAAMTPGHAGVLIALARIKARFYPDDLADIMFSLLGYWEAHYVVTSPDCPVTVDGELVGRLQPPDMVECLATDEENCYARLFVEGRTVRAAVPLDAVQPMAGAVSAAEHAWRALDHELGGAGPGSRDDPVPLSPQEMMHVVTEGISPELLRACLRETSINAVLPVELLAGLAQEAGWAPWQTMAVLERYLDDQVSGGAALASLVETEIRDETVHAGQDSLFAVYRFSNTGNVPLTGILMRRTYLDKDENVLGSSEAPLRTANPILAAGASVDLEYHYDDYEALQEAGVDSDDVRLVRLKAVSARNALALQSLRIEIVEQTAAGAAMRVVNPTLFEVTNPQFRVFYEDGSGHPVLHRDTGRPVTSPVLTLRETVGPGETSGRLSLGEYATAAGAQRLGIPYSVREVLPVIRCVDCQLSLP
jgi:hypothetical protein